MRLWRTSQPTGRSIPAGSTAALAAKAGAMKATPARSWWWKSQPPSCPPDLDIMPAVRGDHADISSWLEVLKNDKRAIVSSAAHAQKALYYLHGLHVNLRKIGRMRVISRMSSRQR